MGGIIMMRFKLGQEAGFITFITTVVLPKKKETEKIKISSLSNASR